MRRGCQGRTRRDGPARVIIEAGEGAEDMLGGRVGGSHQGNLSAMVVASWGFWAARGGALRCGRSEVGRGLKGAMLLCMCVCVCGCVCTCMGVCGFRCVCVWVCVGVCRCVGVCLCVCVHARV